MEKNTESKPILTFFNRLFLVYPGYMVRFRFLPLYGMALPDQDQTWIF